MSRDIIKMKAIYFKTFQVISKITPEFYMIFLMNNYLFI